MKSIQGRTAVITGAASGFGLEVAKVAASEGMRVVLADVEVKALEEAELLVRALGAETLAVRTDVSQAASVEALASATLERFGAPHFVFNNAGVGAGGLIWENSAADWEWVFGVNVMGVAHGVRVFTPLMLKAASEDASYEGHITNTASMAGLQSAPAVGVYNASKCAVVGLTETLFHDLSLVTTQIGVSLLCPGMVPTGIERSERNRHTTASLPLTMSQQVAKYMSTQAMRAAKTSASDVALMVMQALRDKQFYVITHPKALQSVQMRMEDILQGRSPTDPFAQYPGVREQLRAALNQP